MRGRILLINLLIPLIFVGITFSQSSERNIDYQSMVAANATSDPVPVGYSFDNYGPFTAHDRIWVFYSDGNSALYKTKVVGDETGPWSNASIVFSGTTSSFFNVAFDGRFFHFIRAVGGDLRYRRGEAKPDGSIQFTSEVTAYSHPIWQLRTVQGGLPRHFSIAVDHEGKPWVALKVADGDDVSSNFKPIATSSVAEDGTWQTRDGFPVDLAVAYDARGYGRAPNVSEIAPGAILFTWNHDRRSDPRGTFARLWDNGTLGGIEQTGLSRESATTSIVVPQEGIVMLNSGPEVARRNQDGSWVRVDPEDMNYSLFNVLTVHNSRVRLWDFDGSTIRYKETQNNGNSWGSLTGKWTSTENIHHIGGTHAHGSQGSHHSVLWSAGDSPYDIYIGIEGTFDFPDAPLLVSPPDGSQDIEDDVTFVWRSNDVAYGYELQVSRNLDFSPLVINEFVVSDTSLLVTNLDANIVHVWRVRAVTEGGARSDWSEVWSFGTVGLPPAPVLLSPANAATNQPTSVPFMWESVPGGDRYQLQVATVSDFSATFADVGNIQDTTTLVSGFDFDRTYYWRVRGGNILGNGDWSQVRSFTTMMAVPPAPELATPEDGAEDVLTTLQLTWNESATATSYRVQVSEQSGFMSTVVNEGNIANTSFTVSNLEHSKTYYWRVNASNVSGTGGWSAIRSFTTIIERPETPVLLSPVFGSESISTFPVIRWDASARAETYRVVVATDSQFTNIVINRAELDTTQYVVTDELEEFTTHYWRVNATNIGGTSDWTVISHFTTDQAVPPVPVLVGPADETTNVTNATMLWNAVPTATAYRLQVSKDSDFSTTAIDRVDITNTFFQATNLEKFTTYYWRVRGISRVGQGYWSEAWSFTTGDIVSVELIDNQIPTEFALGQNYPNPFNPVTTIRFALPVEATVRLAIYNMLGQQVATIIDGEYYAAGIYEATWNSRDVSGNEVSSGMYIYRITAGDYVETKRMILMK